MADIAANSAWVRMRPASYFRKVADPVAEPTQEQLAYAALSAAPNKVSAPVPVAPVAPVAPAPEYLPPNLGGGDTLNATDNYGPSATAQGQAFFNDPKYKEYLEKMDQGQLDTIRVQKEGLGAAQQNIESYKALPNQMDLSPLMALTDEWSGSSLAKTYKRPVSSEEKFMTIANLESVLQKARAGVTDSEKERLQQYLTNRQKTAGILNEATIADLKRRELNQQRNEKDGFSREKFKMEMLSRFDKSYGENIRGLTQMSSAVSNAKGILETTGGKIPTFGSTAYNEFRAEISKAITAYNRDQAKLGALSGGDLTLLQQAVGVDENIATAAMKQLMFNKDIRSILDNVLTDSKTSVAAVKAQSKDYKKYIPEAYDETFNYFDKNSTGREGTVVNAQAAALESMKGL